MARYEENTSAQGLFLSINLETQFDNASREYILKQYISDHLDEKLFDYAYKNDHTGRKIKNPKDVTAAILYGYMTGNRSSRKIESMLKHHIGFMYVSNCLEIDHSVLCEFKIKFQDQIEFIFGQMLYVLNSMGAIDWDLIMGDGTKLKAYASRDMNIGKDKTKVILKTYKKMAHKIVERDLELEKEYEHGNIPDKKYNEEKSRIERQKRKYESTISKIEAFVHSDEEELKKKLKTQYVNITDPDSKIMTGSSRRHFIQGYNALMMLSNNDVVLSVDPVTDSEKKYADIMVHRVEELKRKLEVKHNSKYMFDSGFQDIEKILKLQEEGYDMYVATKEKDFTAKSQKRKNFSVVTKGDDFYLECKGGTKAKGYYYPSSKKVYFNFYQEKCKSCYNYKECYSKISIKTPSKMVNFNILELTSKDKIESYLQKMQSSQGSKIYSRRLGKEHVFANIKTQRNYLQTYYRGGKKVKMDIYWAALAQNMHKYVMSMR